jgi:3-oxoacyl-[acyl-carrier-protein] synthase-3
MLKKYLSGLAYSLGEERRDYTDIDEFDAAAEAAGLPNLPDVMGFGSFFVTRDVYQCASTAIGKSIAQTNIPPDAIDQVVFCSSAFKERTFSDRNVKIGRVLRNWDIKPKRISGVSGTGCADVLSAIDIACAMLDRGSANNVLVVGVEAFLAGSDRERVMSHALISDAAISFLVSHASGGASDPARFEIIATEIASDVGEIGGGMSITPSSPDRSFIRNALQKSNTEQSDIDKVFGNNIYLPIKTSREGIVGFSAAQLYLENVERTGHCLGCDSIINLVDFGAAAAGGRYVLYAEAEGHRGCVALSLED